MTVCVLDASAALAWVLPDERRPDQSDLLARIIAGGAVVPALWLSETANTLVLVERRRRITAAQRSQAVGLLRALPLQFEPALPDRIWGEVSSLAARHGLTTYDATYLEAALRHGLPLASLDRDLRAAAEACGVATSVS